MGAIARALPGSPEPQDTNGSMCSRGFCSTIAALPTLERTWRDVSGDELSFDAVLIDAKRRVIANILASEFTVLTRLLARIARGHYTTRDHSAERLRAAFELFIVHFPIYRTYVTASGPSREDRAVIEGAIAKARDDWFGSDVGIFDFLRDALTLDLVAPGRLGHSIARARRFAFKVQQFTGPMMAKSLEDTALYRFHRLLALNEVGGNPAVGGMSVDSFHERMQERAAKWPHGLTATATHDTKRGEDARARLLTLSELADEWTRSVHQWRQLNAKLIVPSGASRIPSPAHEYMLYQALLGAWPLTGIEADFVERMQAYAVKAAREGKLQTSWLAPNERYESGLTDFVQRLLDRERSTSFIDSFDAFARRAALIGALNSLAQLLLKATLPGIPDFYQARNSGICRWSIPITGEPLTSRHAHLRSHRSARSRIGLRWRAHGRTAASSSRCCASFSRYDMTFPISSPTAAIVRSRWSAQSPRDRRVRSAR